jgi:hypothetical protein
LSTLLGVTGGHRRVPLHMLAEQVTVRLRTLTALGIRQSAAEPGCCSRKVREVAFRRISTEAWEGTSECILITFVMSASWCCQTVA